MAFKNVKSLSFSYYYIPVIVIALCGVANMVYLGISHYRVYTDIGYESFCAISRAINCDTVSQSTYSILWNVPLPVWGVLSHLFVAYIVILAGTPSANKQRMWPLLFWVLLLFSLYSLYLGIISTVYIKSYCIMCILGYMVNFSLLYYAWFINRRFGNIGLTKGLVTDLGFLRFHWNSFIPILLFLILFASSGPFWFPQYWQLKEPEPTTTLASGITEDGYPWIGAENPILEIVEFADYMCFQCRKMHYHLRRFIESNPDKIRLIHRHFPMDHQYNPLVREPFHIGAGKLALLSIHAKNKGKFWEANDYFYIIGARRESVKISYIASAIELQDVGLARAVYEHEYITKLYKDIKDGLELGITATPAYVIEGKLYQGQIPPQILLEALRE